MGKTQADMCTTRYGDSEKLRAKENERNGEIGDERI